MNGLGKYFNFLRSRKTNQAKRLFDRPKWKSVPQGFC